MTGSSQPPSSYQAGMLANQPFAYNSPGASPIPPGDGYYEDSRTGAYYQYAPGPQGPMDAQAVAPPRTPAVSPKRSTDGMLPGPTPSNMGVGLVEQGAPENLSQVLDTDGDAISADFSRLSGYQGEQASVLS